MFFYNSNTTLKSSVMIKMENGVSATLILIALKIKAWLTVNKLTEPFENIVACLCETL